MGLYNDAVSALNPTHYWKLDNATGNFTDSGSANVTLQKFNTITQNISGGIDGSTHIRTSSGGYAQATISNSIFTDRIFTICGWVKKGTSNSGQQLFGTSTGATARAEIRFDGTNAVARIHSDGGSQFVSAGGIFNTDWHFYTLVANNTTMAFYVDGQQIGATVAISGNLNPSGNFGLNDLFLGGNGDHYFDEIAIFNSALNGAQIRNLYLQQSANYRNSMQAKINSYNPEYYWQGDATDAATPVWYTSGTALDYTTWARTTTSPSGNIARVSSTLPTAMPGAFMLSIPYASRYRTAATVYSSTEATDSDFVVGVWFKQNTGSSNASSLTKILGTTGSVFDMTMYSSTHSTSAGKLLWTTAGTASTGNIRVDDGNWHFLAIRKVTGNNDYKCYVDGVLDVTNTTASAMTAGNWQVGDSTQGSGSAAIHVDNFFLATSANVTEANLLSIYNHAFPAATNVSWSAAVFVANPADLMDATVSTQRVVTINETPATASALFVDPQISTSSPSINIAADPMTASADMADPSVGISVSIAADQLVVTQILIIEPSIVTTAQHTELADPMTASALLRLPSVSGSAVEVVVPFTASAEAPHGFHGGAKVPYVFNYQLRMNSLIESSPNTNFQIASGGAAYIHRIWDNSPYTLRSVIFKFQGSMPDAGQLIKVVTSTTVDSDLGGIDGPVDVDVYRVDADWNHTTITWNNQPAKTYLYTVRISDDGFNYPWPDNTKTLDLTRAIKEDIGYGIVLQASQQQTYLGTESTPIKMYYPRALLGGNNSYLNQGYKIDPAGNIDTNFLTMYSSNFAEVVETAAPATASALMVDPVITADANINVPITVWTATADQLVVIVDTTSNVAIMSPVLDATAEMANAIGAGDITISIPADPADANAEMANAIADTSGNINPMADPADASAEAVNPATSTEVNFLADVMQANANMENESIITEGNLVFNATIADASAESVMPAISGDVVINVTGQIWTGTGDMFTVIVSTTSNVAIVSAILEASADIVNPAIWFDNQIVVDESTASADIVNAIATTTSSVNILADVLDTVYATIVSPNIWLGIQLPALPFIVSNATLVNPPLITTANNGGYIAEVMTATARQREPLRLNINSSNISMPQTTASLWKRLHGGNAIEGLLNDNFEHGFHGGTGVSYLNQPVSMLVLNNQNVAKYAFGPDTSINAFVPQSLYTASQLESKFVNCYTQFQPVWPSLPTGTVTYGNPTTYNNPIDRTGYSFDGTEFIHLRDIPWSTFNPDVEIKTSTSVSKTAAIDGNPVTDGEYYEFGIKTSKLNQILLYGESRNVLNSTTRQAREYGTRNGYLYYRYYSAINQNPDLFEETLTDIYISDNKFHQLVIQRIPLDGNRHDGFISAPTLRRTSTTYTDPVTKTMAVGKEIYLDGTLRHRNTAWADKAVPRLIMFGAAARQRTEIDQNDNSYFLLEINQDRLAEFYEGVVFAFIFRETSLFGTSTTTTSWYTLHAPATPEFIQKAYTYLLSLAIGEQDIPMRVSAELVEPVVSTNAKTILRLFWNTDESVAAQNGLATNIANTNVKTYCVSKKMISDPSYTYNTDYAYVNDITDPEAASNAAVGGIYSSGGLDYPRFINFATDIPDYANVDIISFIDYPETSDELTSLFPGYDPQYIMHIYDQFLGQLRQAVFVDGKNLFISSPRLVMDLGLADEVRYVSQDANASEPFDNDRINKYHIIGREEGLTSMPSWVINEVKSDENDYTIDYVNKNNGLTIGDRFYIPGLPVRNIQLTTDLAGQIQNRRGTKPIAAFRLEHLNYNAQPIAKLFNVDNAVTTFIIKPSARPGQTVNGKIFVNTAEDALTLGLVEYNKGVRQIVPPGDLAETPDILGYDWSSKRLKENYEWPTQFFEADAGTGQIAPTLGGGGPIIQAATASSNGNIGVVYYANEPEYISNIYPPFSAEKYRTEIIDVLSMTYRGVNWLLQDNVPGIATDALSLNAILPEPTITAQKHATVNATSMYAKEMMLKISEATNPASTVIRVLPMFAHAKEIIIGTKVIAPALTASAMMINNFNLDFAGGEQITLVVHHVPLITLYLKEES